MDPNSQQLNNNGIHSNDVHTRQLPSNNTQNVALQVSTLPFQQDQTGAASQNLPINPVLNQSNIQSPGQGTAQLSSQSSANLAPTQPIISAVQSDVAHVEQGIQKDLGIVGQDVTNDVKAAENDIKKEAEEVEEEEAKTLKVLHKYNKIVGYFVIAFVVLLSLGNILYVFHIINVRHNNYQKYYNNLPSVKQATAQSEFGPNVETRTDGKLDLTNLISPNLNSFQQYISFSLNQQVNFSNGMSFMVTGFQKGWQSQSYYSPLNTSDYLVELNFVIGNRTNQTQTMSIPDVNATFNSVSKNVLSYPYDQSINGLPNLVNMELNTQLQPHQQIGGAIVVEVPNNTLPPLTFTAQGYNYNYQQINMNATISL